MQFDKYIGLPYQEKGRDFSGVDCWGLARLFYKNEFQIDLPSFSDEYELSDSEHIQELIAQYKEGWEKVDTPARGSLILFRVNGTESHVGISIGEGKFIHAREGMDSVIDSLESARWKKRIVGYFKYSEKKAIVLNAAPHPLKTQKYTIPVPPNTRLDKLVDGLSKEFGIADELKVVPRIILNGRIVKEEDFATTILEEGDKLEYRAVPRGGANMLRTVALIAIAIYAPYLAGQLTGYASASAAAATMGTTVSTGLTVMNAAATIGIMLAGTAIVNAIAPVRPPTSASGNATDPGTAERQLLLDTAANTMSPYGAIPIVLGKVRMTPFLGANSFVTYANERDSYLSMMMVWGYGPLSIDQSSYRIGSIPLTNYDLYTKIDLDRKTEPDANTLAAFNSIYGNDTVQNIINTDLTCDANPEVSSPTPGPWLQSSTTQKTSNVTIAIHFPQGCRKIVTKGNNAGDSAAAPVHFRVEISTNGGSTYTPYTFVVGNDTAKKDGFTYTQSYAVNGTGTTIVRVRRESGDHTQDNPNYAYYHQATFANVIFSNNDNPAIDPRNCKIAKTALRIKATDQLNGRIDGVNAIVQTHALSWNGTSWVMADTNNPADLMRYVLEHPANPRRVTNASTQIDLASLQAFHEYCTQKGFTYNSVVAQQRSVLEILRDVCAAGRASPSMVDGKWTVIIDQPKSNIVQHFTPHNSWGFEATKALPKQPQALRVTYFDEDQDWKEAEVITYKYGYDDSNTDLYEQISLPGVTKKSAVIDHCKWHIAQIQLRPEVYVLNVDLEYLVCNRGDRVVVNHDVPMWGAGSGRVKEVINTTDYVLDNEVLMEANKSYQIRFRSKTGVSTVRYVIPVAETGWYTEISLSTGLTTEFADAGDLFLFGEINSDSTDLVVLKVEPTSTKTARLTLMDYGVNQQYDIFNQYLFLSNNTVFETNITQQTDANLNAFGTKVPTLQGFVSDESVMERVQKGIYKYAIAVSYINALNLPVITDGVEVQYDLADATNTLNARSVFVPYARGAAVLTDVQEGKTYKIRARYGSTDGRVGQWTNYTNHTVQGKVHSPSTPTGFVANADPVSGMIDLQWKDNPEADVYTYEVRKSDSGWGSDDNDRLFYGDATKAVIPYYGVSGSPITIYLRAQDTEGRYTQASQSVTFSPTPVTNVLSVSYSFDTALTVATVRLTWADVVTQFLVDYYELSYDGEHKTIRGNSIVLPADWTGNKTFTLKTVDMFGNKSTGTVTVIGKLSPGTVSAIRTQVIDNTVMLYWTLPNKTSLPIDHVLIRKGADFNTSTIIGEKKGAFTTITETAAGIYTYWFQVVDTQGVLGEAVSTTTSVAEPPDFVFNGEFTSTFNGTLNLAAYDGSSKLFMPVSTTELFGEHFSSRGWTTPQNQVDAGYPLYLVPYSGTGYYQEVFDFGTELQSSRIQISYNGQVLVGNPAVTYAVWTSPDQVTWTLYTGTLDVFATNFRYVRVRITVDSYTTVGLYSIDTLHIRLDAKVKSDNGTVACLATDPNGTLVSYNKEFIDVSSWTITAEAAQGSTPSPITCVYAIKDVFQSAKYFIRTAGVTKVYISNHGLNVGDRVKIIRSSGNFTTGIYTVTAQDTLGFSFADASQPDGNGYVSYYPQSFRVYLFNSAGVRVSANASWNVKGY